MSLRPLKKSRRRHRSRIVLNSQQSDWDWTPFRNRFLGEFDPRAAVKVLLVLGLIFIIYIPSDYAFGGPLFHSYSTVTVAYPGAQAPPCSIDEIQTGNCDPAVQAKAGCTNSEILAGWPCDPPTQALPYRETLSTSDLSDFNTVNAKFASTAQTPIGVRGINLSPFAFPKGQGVFTPGQLNVLGASLSPNSNGDIYNTVYGFNSNTTFWFSIIGWEAREPNNELLTYSISTTNTTEVTFYSQQPSAVVTCTCVVTTSQTEIHLAFNSGLSNSPFSIQWSVAFTQQFTAIALTKNPIDLSLAVSRELWMGAVFDTKIANIEALPGSSFGFYLTVNGTLPSVQLYNPLADPSVRFVYQINVTAVDTYTYSVFILHNVGGTIDSESATGCATASSCYIQATGQTSLSTVTHDETAYLSALNFTGPALNPSDCTSMIFTGSDCSYITTSSAHAASGIQPTLNIQGVTYFLGYYDSAGSTSVTFPQSQGTLAGEVAGFMYTFVPIPPPVPNPTQSTYDSGGFFGSVWNTLTSVGGAVADFTKPVWGPIASAGANILGSLYQDVLSALEAVGSYMINTAFPALEGLLTSILNTIGNLLFPGSNIGTLLFSFVNDIFQLLTNTSYGLPAFFTNFPSYFANFLHWLQIVFPFLAPIFTVANGILLFAVNGISIGIFIMTIGLQMILFGYGTLIVVTYFVYTGDDGIGGFLTMLGTLEALSFNILNLIATIVNLGLDLLIVLISLIPKPFVQMSASKVPRLPLLETSASMRWPVMDLGEARNGNMIVFWLWSLGLYFACWFESHNPSLPGSIAQLFPASAANIQRLSALLPLLQAIVLVMGGIVLAWYAMMPLRIVGFDIMELSPIGVGLGRVAGAPSGVKITGGKKHLVGPAKSAETERKRQREFEAKKEEEARKGIAKTAKKEEDKRRSEQLRRKEIERKPTGKDLRGPDLT